MKFLTIVNKRRSLIFDGLVLLSIAIFSWWLMSSTFGYQDGKIIIDSKLYSDFGAHLPLIRSFSLGKNWPPEYPFFAGEPIRYHYFFYLLVGFLEKIGLRLDLALNILSSLGMTLLLWLIYKITNLFAKTRLAGWLAVILFLFNGSLSFVEYFNQQGWNWQALLAIPEQVNFASFGPWSGRLVSAFWNLNIYTNQRHLALSFALVLLFLYPLLVKIAKLPVSNFKLSWPRKIKTLVLQKCQLIKDFVLAIFSLKTDQSLNWFLAFGLVIGYGLMPVLHQAGFIILVYFTVYFLLFYPKVFGSLKPVYLAALGVSLLSFYFLTTGDHQPVERIFGFLAEDKTFLGLIRYWWYNLGFYLPLLPILLFYTLKKKNFFLFFATGLFVAANIWRLSPDMINNHKLLNFFMIVVVITTAIFLINLVKKSKAFLFLTLPLFLLLTFSGFVDLFPIINDYSGEITDYPRSDIQQWLLKNTAGDSQFLTASYLHSPASLTGRKLYLDYGYHAWSMGYKDAAKRVLLPELWSDSISPTRWCGLALSQQLDYVLVGPSEKAVEDDKIKIDQSLVVSQLPPAYVSPDGWRVWDIKEICSKK